MNMITEKEGRLIHHKIAKARNRGDLDTALIEIQVLLLDESPDVKANGLWYRGMIREDQGALIEAKQDWLAALAHAPERSLFKYQLEEAVGRVCEKLGTREEALTWYRRALTGPSGVLSLASFMRVNGPNISSADLSLLASVIEKSWLALKLPGTPDLTDLPAAIGELGNRIEEVAAEAMIIPEIGEVIGQRRLAFIDPQGREREALIEIGRPVPSDEIPDQYRCRYRITGIDFERVSSVHGVDQVQALQLVMRGIGMELSDIRETVDGELRWEAGVAGDLGFPID